MSLLEELGEELSLSHPDPVVLELNRLHNLLKEKNGELKKAQSEFRALRATEVLKDKAMEQFRSQVKRLEEKLSITENLLEQKNLGIKKLADEKREALTAQHAAEAALRSVYANQKDDDYVPIESIIAPLDAELKMYKNEIGALQEDKRAMERLTKSKEAALLEAEKILKSALERVLIVEEVQNENFELRRQIEICQEENKILDKTNRQKVSEIEKLSQTIIKLEEAILAGGTAANTVRDYRRQIDELNEEKKILERELARVKVSANRIATVVANEWKDENNRVMPVKKWLEERKMFQAKIQWLKEKLAISERATKAEAQLKDKLKLRLKILEEGLKHVSSFSVNSNGSPKIEKSNNLFGILASNTRANKRSTSQLRLSTATKSLMQTGDERQSPGAARETKADNSLNKKYSSGGSFLKKSLWASRNKIMDCSEKENEEINENTKISIEKCRSDELRDLENIKSMDSTKKDSDDMVSGFLYDRLQKEVIYLRKSCKSRDSTLNSKNEEIKILMKKTKMLTGALEKHINKDRGCLLMIHLKKRGPNYPEITPVIKRVLNISTCSEAENLTVV
ncbi:unnamed protein product [Fraxinus pennsylvanica]|uniref:Microtubule-associated protein 70-5 n=1 Tax=Fraxinus pennsylvanica TaxID=56036 RepID=A0AAD1YU24_9LAMI|nr:unnamed protein product [Fraxinus pennsylvanica]